MLIWKGKGLLVILAGWLGILGGGQLALLLAGRISFLTPNSMLAINLFSAAVMNFLFCRLFVSDSERVLVDRNTGQEYLFRDDSSLFFIPNRYWTYILLAAGVWVLLVQSK